MTDLGRLLGVLFGSLATAGSVAIAQPSQPGPGPAMPASTPANASTAPGSMPAQPPTVPPPTSPAPTRIVLSEVVEPGYRDAVLGVARKPTIATRGISDAVVCTPAVYEWLLEHPDRTSLAWRRLKVPCVEISDIGNGKFSWADGEGSELTWQTVGRFPNGLVWYATGKVKPSAVTPSVPVRAVVVMTHPKEVGTNGTATISPAVQVYMQTDSKAATVVMRMMGPTAPKLAQQGAEQLLFFFTGIARYLQAHPDQVNNLLGPAKASR